jgi:hypothetical protein
VEHVAVTINPGSVRRLNDTLRLCRTFFVDRRKSLWTRERNDWLAAGIRGLHQASPPPDDEIEAFASLAFAGWCWRAAERGEPERLQAAFARAHAAVKRDQSVPVPLRPAWTAWRFLREGGEPGLASPGPTSRLRLAFLRAAFDRMHATFAEPLGIDGERSRCAFAYGVALHDVERLILKTTR